MNQVSQSAASQHVQDLERALGIILLDRSTRPLVVNAAGQLYSDFCRDVLRRKEEFEVALDLLERDLRHALGRQGQDHVWNAYNWEEVLRAYRVLFDAFSTGPSTNGAMNLYDERTDEDARPGPKTRLRYG